MKLLRADIARRRDDGRSKEATRRNLHRKEIKSRQRTTEDAEKAKTMKFKYMKSAEFKARQAWLDFVDAVGIALQIMAEVKENSAAWLKKWVKNFRMPTARRVAPVQEALELVIGTNILKWADWTPTKNYELELKPIEIKKSNIDYDPDPDGYWEKCKKEFRNQKVTIDGDVRGWMVYIGTREYLKNRVTVEIAEIIAAETRILVKQGGPLNYPS